MSMREQDELIRRLDALDGSDPEVAHGDADRLIEEALPEEVRQAYVRVQRRCRWWGSS